MRDFPSQVWLLAPDGEWRLKESGSPGGVEQHLGDDRAASLLEQVVGEVERVAVDGHIQIRLKVGVQYQVRQWHAKRKISFYQRVNCLLIVAHWQNGLHTLQDLKLQQFSILSEQNKHTLVLKHSN